MFKKAQLLADDGGNRFSLLKTRRGVKISPAIFSRQSATKTLMGKRLSFSNGRRLVDDIIRVSTKMPLAAFSSEWDVEIVGKLRRMAKPKISWNVLMMKAHAIVCRENAMLRQSYVRFPYPHLYEHHQSVCMLTIGREHQGEDRLFFARFAEPDNQTLVKLQERYDKFRKAPIEEIKQFRHQITFAKLPSPVRRFAWWSLFNLWPQKRASHMGTFGMSISGHRGAKAVQHLGCNTTILGVDPNPRKGVANMLLTFDHQIIDGAPATDVFAQGQRALTTIIAKELADMAGVNVETLQPLSDSELHQVRIDREQEELHRKHLKEERRRQKWGRKRRSASRAA